MGMRAYKRGDIYSAKMVRSLIQLFTTGTRDYIINYQYEKAV